MIYRWVETGAIHYKEAPNGSLIVCVKSLAEARKFNKGEKRR